MTFRKKKEFSETQQFKANLEKILQDHLLKFELNISETLKYFLIQVFYETVKKITLYSGSLCEKDSKSLLSEEYLTWILIDLGLGRYVSEVKEEQNRTKNEEIKLAKINI